MLEILKIENVALIKNLELNFSDGFNVLLGSTGAGKSIIFDALNFVLGSQADKTLIRSGENSMRVEAVFSALNADTRKYLIEAGYLTEEDDCLILSRSLDVGGKSAIRINGGICNLQMLRECTANLVDSYSQHESITLLKSKNHLAMLDKLGGDKIAKIKAELKTEYDVLSEIKKKIASLGGDESERERTRALLEYQIKEIEDAELKEGEEEELEERIKLMSSAEKIFEASKACENLLDTSSMSAISSVHEAASQLSSLSQIEEISALRDRLNSCKYELSDICESLKDIAQRCSYDEGELDRLNRRKDLIKMLCKKYGRTIPAVLEYLDKTRTRLDELTGSEILLSKLQKEETAQTQKVLFHCENLRAVRKTVALDTQARVQKELRELGMKNTTFIIEFGECEVSANGYDEAEFTFSANKGQEVKALSKTASGGEMSRVMLAFKTIFAEAGYAETLIFDEIDTGISGETGYVVGEKLSRLAKSSQVLLITHLAQVACQAGAFYYVSKSSDDSSTYTSVKQLHGADIDVELARMLGGDNITDVSLAHIKEMRAHVKRA